MPIAGVPVIPVKGPLTRTTQAVTNRILAGRKKALRFWVKQTCQDTVHTLAGSVVNIRQGITPPGVWEYPGEAITPGSVKLIPCYQAKWARGNDTFNRQKCPGR